MRTLDIAWLGGLLEGEGYFYSLGPRAKGHSPYPYITLQMTDRDTVQRAADLMGVKVKAKPEQRQPHHKLGWRCQAGGRRAASWMMMIFPFLGERRQAKVTDILSAWRSHTQLRCTPGEQRIPTCGHPDKKHSGGGLCHTCYVRARRARLKAAAA